MEEITVCPGLYITTHKMEKWEGLTPKESSHLSDYEVCRVVSLAPQYFVLSASDARRSATPRNSPFYSVK